MEIWKEAFNHPNYEVTETGKIRRKKNGKELSPYITDRGYRAANLWIKQYKRTKIRRIGKVVWETFNDCECKQTIDHIDRNKLNDNISNLRCVSQRENSKNKDIYSRTNKYNLDDNKKKEIITHLTSGEWTLTSVWKLFGIPTNYMSSVIRRGTWNYLLNDKK